MAKIHNQKKMEQSLNRCDSLAVNMIDRDREIKFKRAMALSENLAEVNDYIFGLTEVNPLQEYTDQINENITEYKDLCKVITQEVVASRR